MATPKSWEMAELRDHRTAIYRRMNTHSIYPHIGNCAITRVTIQGEFRFWEQMLSLTPSAGMLPYVLLHPFVGE